jgi:hypothetical protein
VVNRQIGVIEKCLFSELPNKNLLDFEVRVTCKSVIRYLPVGKNRRGICFKGTTWNYF